MRRRPLFLLAAAGLLALTSCLANPTTTGELGNGQFTYKCVNGSDLACEGFTGGASVPALIAVGAPFDLEYKGESTSSAPVKASSASDAMITSSTGGFTFVRPGVGAMLARNTSGGVADFVHLRAAKLDHLDVAGPSSTAAVTTVEMGAGTTVSLQAAPKDASGEVLSGGLWYTWTSSDEAVVSLAVSETLRRVGLDGHKPGTATIEVTAPGGVKRSVVVTVTADSTTSTSSGSGGASSSSGATGTTTSSSGAGGAGGGP